MLLPTFQVKGKRAVDSDSGLQDGAEREREREIDKRERESYIHSERESHILTHMYLPEQVKGEGAVDSDSGLQDAQRERERVIY